MKPCMSCTFRNDPRNCDNCPYITKWENLRERYLRDNGYIL